MSVTRPVVKTATLKKTKIKPACVLASPWKVANLKGGTFTWAQAMGSRCFSPIACQPRRFAILLTYCRVLL